MSFNIPAEIEICQGNFQATLDQYGELFDRRDKLSRNNSPEPSEIAEIQQLLEAHESLVEPTKDMIWELKQFLTDLRSEIKENLADASNEGNEAKFKGEAWYKDRQEVSEDLNVVLGEMTSFITDLKFDVKTMGGKIARVQKSSDESGKGQTGPGPSHKATEKAVKSKQVTSSGLPTQTKKSESQGAPQIRKKSIAPKPSFEVPTPMIQPESTLENHAQLADKTALVEFSSLQPMQSQPSQTSQTSPSESIPASSMSLTNRSARFAPDTVSSLSMYFQKEVQKRDEMIQQLKIMVEDLSSRRKQQHDDRDQLEELKVKDKKLAEVTEQLENIKEENAEHKKEIKKQKKLQEKLEANHQELLKTIKKGFSKLTIEMLRLGH